MWGRPLPSLSGQARALPLFSSPISRARAHLMKILHLNQHGKDWHQWRQGGIGGSDASAITGDSPFVSPELLARSKREGNTKVIKENARMKRGKKLEPLARIKYQDITGIRVRPVCVVHSEHEWLMASLDGLSEDHQIILEIKCPSPHTHETALLGEVPHYYIPQVQHQLMVTGCPQLHYFSYTDSSKFRPEEKWALVKVLPDKDYQDWLFRKERAWWQEHQAKGPA